MQECLLVFLEVSGRSCLCLFFFLCVLAGTCFLGKLGKHLFFSCPKQTYLVKAM